jgi:hypothetical protein
MTNMADPAVDSKSPFASECTVPWCGGDHRGEEPGDLVHLSPVETAGPVELMDQFCDGRMTTVIQVGGFASESLDGEELDVLIAALLRHRLGLAAHGARVEVYRRVYESAGQAMSAAFERGLDAGREMAGAVAA